MRRTAPWILWAVAMVLLAVTVAMGAVNGSFGEDPLFLAIAIVMILGYTTVGAVIASRVHGNPIGWLLMTFGIGFLFGGMSDEYLKLAFARGWEETWLTTWMGWLTNWVFIPLAMPVPLILLLFPSGALPSTRWRLVAAAIVALFVLVLLAAIVNPGPIDADPSVEPPPTNPTGVPALAGVVPVIFTVAGYSLLCLGLLAVVGLVLRFRRSRGDERQQMRWFVAAVTLAAPLLVGAIVTGWGLGENETRPLNELFFFAFSIVLGIGLPIACAVAILRYRLYDLDLVVKKTVLYTVVALVLSGLFLGLAAFVGRAVIEASPAAILGSIVIGLAFWPAVRLARRLADRVVYGRRATPYEVLTEFSGRVAGSYADEDVLPRMARIVLDAIGARRAIVWLRVGEELRPAGIAPSGADVPEAMGLDGGGVPPLPDDTTVEVRDQGELLGAISVSTPANDPMNPSKERLVRDLASQAGLVLRNVRLIEELRESRQRLVAAQDAERRRLERNIHDGAQQQLVALTVQLRLLEQLASREPERAAALAAQLQGLTTEALEDLRDLARDIYPPLLADEGLRAALDAQARKSPVPVTVDADGIGRYPQDVEAAVYFSCLEAMNNVAKYAGASRAEIRLAHRDSHLTFTVVDDGVGFDPVATRRGTGLQGIADRVDALRGRFDVRSEPGSGTTLIGSVPVPTGPVGQAAPRAAAQASSSRSGPNTALGM
jgi:signal transduction histidine kinase